MNNSLGEFSRDLFYLGERQGPDELEDGSLFRQESGLQALYCGMGNRVNLFVQNNIDYIADDPPQYGLILQWAMRSTERQVPNYVPLENSGNMIWQSGTGGVLVSSFFDEMLLEPADPSPANPHVKAAAANYKFIALPNKKDDHSEGFFSFGSIGRINMVFPVTALGDRMMVRFYSSPTDHVYDEFDSIRVWGCVGHDAIGANHA